MIIFPIPVFSYPRSKVIFLHSLFFSSYKPLLVVAQSFVESGSIKPLTKVIGSLSFKG